VFFFFFFFCFFFFFFFFSPKTIFPQWRKMSLIFRFAFRQVRLIGRESLCGVLWFSGLLFPFFVFFFFFLTRPKSFTIETKEKNKSFLNKSFHPTLILLHFLGFFGCGSRTTVALRQFRERIFGFGGNFVAHDRLHFICSLRIQLI